MKAKEIENTFLPMPDTEDFFRFQNQRKCDLDI